jgi:hypothetical protein
MLGKTKGLGTVGVLKSVEKRPVHENNRLRTLLRPEVIALVAVPTSVLILLAATGMLDRRLVGVHFWTSLVYLQFFGWQFFYAICFVAFGYLLFSVVAYAIERRRAGLGTSGELPPPASRLLGQSVERLRAAGSLAGLTAIYAYALVVHFIAMNALCQPDRQRVAWADELMMRADYTLFGTYVPFAMHEDQLFRVLSGPMLFCYLKLGLVIALVLIALCVFRADRFRQYLLAFVMVMFLGLPGWFAAPAVTPSEAYRLNKPGVGIPLDIALDTAVPIVNLHPSVVRLLDGLEPCQSVAAQGRFFITSFPSMHVAWGMLAV